MSRTRAARELNDSDSSPVRPNSFTSSAPATLNRSVMVAFIDALSVYDSRVMSCNRLPMRRAGSTNSGSITSDSRVICHDRLNITAAVSTRLTTFETSPDRVEVNACCAPSTSLFSRLTSAPVCVRVKNASGMRWTWSKTAVRIWKIRPSPIREEYQRWANDSTASITARTAMTTAIRTTALGAACPVMSLTTRPASTGVATAISESATTSARKTRIATR